MAAGTRVLCFLIICSLVCSSRDQKITAELGQDVILPCKAPNKDNINIIRAVEWSRPEMDPDYVLFYRDGRLDPYSQHPSYQNRVDLQDKEMKDGDASLILKNVKMEDTGTYVCRVFDKGKNELISITYLDIHLSGDKDASTGDGGDILGSVGGVILLLLLAVLASVGFLICRRYMRQNPHISFPHSVKAAAKQMV